MTAMTAKRCANITSVPCCIHHSVLHKSLSPDTVIMLTKGAIFGSSIVLALLLYYAKEILKDSCEWHVDSTTSIREPRNNNTINTTTTTTTTTTVASPILFVHLQKSGGSSVCGIMRNQVNMTDMMGNSRTGASSPNCNVEVGGPRDNVENYHTLQTCRLLETYTMDNEGVPFRRDNFVAVEVPFHDAMPCRGFRSFALMRDPVERFLSLMRYSRISEEKVLDWIENKVPPSRAKYMEGYPMINNMVIRQLIGRDRFIDMTPVNEDDLEKAKKQVDAFDAFVPLEYLDNETVLERLRLTIPEYYEGLTRNPVVVNKNTQTSQRQIDQTLIERIAVENVYDTKLYEYVLNSLNITRR